MTVAGDESSWVEPDYMGVPADADLPVGYAEPREVWPGPAMVMPAGLLPDGSPHSYDEFDNAERISGVRPRSAAEAEECVQGYGRQQALLRAEAGLPPARRDDRGQWDEAPETVAAIRELHRRERQRRRRFETPPEVERFLEGLAGASVSVAEEMLRGHGMCPAPTVHVVCADLDQPYAAMLTCRQFYRGADAADAVAEMGSLPSELRATHLLVVWEHADLCTALQLPGETPDGSFASAVVVVEASFSEHLVRRYPFTPQLSRGRSGAPAVLPRWGESTRERGGALPDPIVGLLAKWRTWAEEDRLERTVLDLQEAGYRITWAERT